MVKFQIQRAAPAEGAALCVLLDAAYQPYRDGGVTLPDVTDGLDDEIAAGRVWIAAGTKGPLGLLNLSLDPPAAHLINVAVSPDAKGHGVGGALIRHALALASKAGCSSLDLATHHDLSENVALYQHLGWAITGHEGTRIFMSRVL